MADLAKLLSELHEETVKDLLRRVRDGSATAADLGVARALLKDNNISAVPVAESPLAKLHESLPFPTMEGVSDELLN